YMKLKQLCLSRSKQMILHDLNAQLPSTGVTVLLGANGAGKSTLLNVLAGISELDSGTLQLAANTSVCLMPEPAVFYPQLTVVEQLNFVANLFGQNFDPSCIEAALDVWQLQAVKDKLTQHLSLGYRQRLSLAQLTVAAADLWLLDEPMNGMDPEVLSVFKQQIEALKLSKGIIMATHIMHEAQELADWVVVMHQGQIIYSEAYDNGTPFHELYQQSIQDHQASIS
ncbi:hypothetical protein MNBD_GAMMA02-516, partial [hydrothermal vent metagenome]